MRNFLFATACTLYFFLPAQNYFYSTYTWEKTPVVYVPTETEKKSDLVVVSEKRITEVGYDSDGQAVAYETIHKIYHVNSPKAIDGVNKGYIPMRNVFEEIDLKARCISPANKIIYFNTSSVKSVDNLDGDGPYKIFAIDGVETGCDVEILYTNKKKFSYYNYFFLNTRSPLAHYEVRIITPKNLVFDTKSYNGLESFKSDTSNKEKNHLWMIQKNVAPAEYEKYSAGQTNNMAYIYQFAYNTEKKRAKAYTWDIISRDFYTQLYPTEKEELKQIEKIVNKNKFNSNGDAAEKIKALDSYFKTEFETNDTYDELAFGKAIENKKMGNTNAMKFYIGALKYMQIPFELAVTCDRTDVKFDAKFPSYIFMKEFLLYFPDLNKYLAPLSIYSRLGYVAPDLLTNEGLFIKEVNIGEIFSSSAKTKSIASPDYKDSYHNHEIKATLDFENKTVKLNVTQLFSGYLAFYTQPIYRYLTKEQKDEVHKRYELTDNAESVKDVEVQNVAEGDLYVKPMIVKFNAEQNDFLESANNKFIFKAGLLIGPQSELYQEEKRKWPGEMSYPHYLKRSLEINIPAGYKVTNPDDLKIEKTCLLDGKDVASFKSTYEIKDNKIIVSVYEDYKIVTYPLPIFDDFKAVINAAADFNKKTLIFEKQ